ncbi:MAG: formate--tetrahydrofolate ligase, partial [Chloroflexi bacterium]|nr:formate--tetrahydrofolate ligase [Chloroflexota bacterium]
MVHAGPFANIAHGNSSIIADQIALKLSDYVVTESGFGADMGAEKFMDIKCRYSGLVPNAVVVVCTARALKMHSGQFRVVAGRPLDPGLTQENLPAVEKGAENLIKQVENMRKFGVPVVVAVNRFTFDTPAEINLIKKIAVEAGAEGAFISEVWAKGGEGGRELAEAVVAAAEKKSQFRFLYELDQPIKNKIEIIAKEIYGADGVSYLPDAERKIRMYTRMGYQNLKGRPRNYTIPIRDVRLSAGAGFLYPLLGEMRTMPGLPTEPAGEKVDLDEEGRILGLF